MQKQQNSSWQESLTILISKAESILTTLNDHESAQKMQAHFGDLQSLLSSAITAFQKSSKNPNNFNYPDASNSKSYLKSKSSTQNSETPDHLDKHFFHSKTENLEETKIFKNPFEKFYPKNLEPVLAELQKQNILTRVSQFTHPPLYILNSVVPFEISPQIWKSENLHYFGQILNNIPHGRGFVYHNLSSSNIPKNPIKKNFKNPFNFPKNFPLIFSDYVYIGWLNQGRAEGDGLIIFYGSEKNCFHSEIFFGTWLNGSLQAGKRMIFKVENNKLIDEKCFYEYKGKFLNFRENDQNGKLKLSTCEEYTGMLE